MWAEVIGGNILQTVADVAPVVVQGGTQYPATYPKAAIPNLVDVVMATVPAGEIVTSSTYALSGSTVKQVVTTAAPPAVPPSQIAAAALADALAAGITVTSTATPALNDTYGVMPDDQSNIMAEVQFISAFAEFTTGGQTMPWGDAVGVAHEFPDTATFMAFAKGAARYVSGCKLAAQANAAGAAVAMPSNAVVLP